MIANFRKYSRFYDVLYQNKDYKAEADYIDCHIKKHLPGAKQLLELGCGTGNHAYYLCKTGYEITGIDRSEEMVELAKNKQITNFHASVDEITAFRLGRKFDAVISLFHVMCYLTTNEDLLACFTTVSEHMEPGGIFLFDAWYGPAVLHDLPSTRIKRKKIDNGEVLCLVETRMQLDKNVAEVNYEIFALDNINMQFERFREKHPIRYFTLPEIQLFAERTGFRLLTCEKFLSDEEPDLYSRDIFIVLQKNK